MINIAIFTNIIPTYRESFYTSLFNQNKFNIKVFCQKSLKTSGLKSIHNKFRQNIKIVESTDLFWGRLLWQHLPYAEIFKNFDIFIFDGNPRHLSQAIFSSILALCGKKVIIHSVGHSRFNNPITTNIRIIWWYLFFNNFLTYTKNDIAYLKRKKLKNRIYISINNGLDQKKIEEVKLNWNDKKLTQWKIDYGILGKQIILSTGRLFYDKYKLLMEALPNLINECPNLLWVVIGDGPDKIIMQNKLEENNTASNCFFLGALYDEELLAPWFLSSEVFVHPSAIGLSLFHAYGYGLPVVTHNNKNTQGPEYIAFKDRENGFNYKDGSVKSLESIILALLNNPTNLDTIRQKNLKIVNEHYNTEIMVKRFNKMINLTLEK